MDRGLRGKTVVSQTFEYTVFLHLSDGYSVQLMSPFTFTVAGDSVVITPDEDPEESFIPLRQLVGQTIEDYSVTDSNGLSLVFDSGTRLLCEADDHYESWMVCGPGGQAVVCTPGGELAVWDATES